MRRSADQPSTRPRRGRLAAAALALGLTGALAAAGPSLAGSNPVAQLTVSPAQPMATVPGTAIGINGSTCDSSLLTGAQARAAAATVPPYSITMLTLARD